MGHALSIPLSEILNTLSKLVVNENANVVGNFVKRVKSSLREKYGRIVDMVDMSLIEVVIPAPVEITEQSSQAIKSSSDEEYPFRGIGSVIPRLKMLEGELIDIATDFGLENEVVEAINTLRARKREGEPH